MNAYTDNFYIMLYIDVKKSCLFYYHFLSELRQNDQTTVILTLIILNIWKATVNFKKIRKSYNTDLIQTFISYLIPDTHGILIKDFTDYQTNNFKLLFSNHRNIIDT